jgi:hypothetical protein
MAKATGRVILAAAAAMLAPLFLAAALAAAAASGVAPALATLRPGVGPSALRWAAQRLLLPPLNAWDRTDALLDRHRFSGMRAARRDPRPLRAQAAEMEADLRRRFLTADGRLFLASTPPVETSDLCLWQGVYAATTALDFAREPTASRRRRAEAAFDGLALLAARGRPLARSMLPLAVRVEPSGAYGRSDGRWQWKEDASIDSAVGWVFGAVMTVELLPSRRAQALDALQRYADVLSAGGYLLRNSDGAETRYSKVGGALVNSPTGMLTTLAVLKTLERHGRGARYGEAHRLFVEDGQDRWAAYGTAPISFLNMTTNHNIAVLGLAAALLAENDPGRRARYARGLLRVERLTRKMDNSFWIYLTEWTLSRRPELAAALAGDRAWERHHALGPELRAAAKTSMLQWHYPYNKLKLRRGGPSAAASPVPIYDRPAADFVWQRSPYKTAGWPGVTMSRSQGQAYAPLDFLAAYSLGRAVGAISPDE